MVSRSWRRASCWALLTALAAVSSVHCSLDERTINVAAAGAGDAGGVGGGEATAGGGAGAGAGGLLSGLAGEAGEPNSASCTPACDHGTCRATQLSTQCTCEAGYSGPTCSTNIDDCASDPCQNSGTCIDGIADYACDCTPLFTGKNCDLPRFELIDEPRATAVFAVGANSDASIVVGNASFDLEPTESCATVAKTADSGAGGASDLAMNQSCAYIWTHAAGMRILPPLDGDSTSNATAISADGKVVVGYSTGGGRNVAVRWVGTGAAESLGVLSGDTDSQAIGLSQDGKAILVTSSGGGVNRGARWTAQTGLVSLGAFADNQPLSATAISRDGATVIGNTHVVATGTNVAFLWTDGSPAKLQKLDPLSGEVLSDARALSSDGSVVAGSSAPANSPARPVRWVKGGAAEKLDTTGQAAGAIGISADGSTIFGAKIANSVAFVWNATSKIVLLPTLSGNPIFAGPGVSSVDGTVLGGGCALPAEPTIWTHNAISSIRTILAGAGQDLTGFTFFPAQAEVLLSAMSSDGSVVVGRGISSSGAAGIRGWVARLP